MGVAKAVTVSGIALGGVDAGNYTLAATTIGASADITVRTLIASAIGVSKVYDGSDVAAFTLGDDRIAGDVLTLADPWNIPLTITTKDETHAG